MKATAMTKGALADMIPLKCLIFAQSKQNLKFWNEFGIKSINCAAYRPTSSREYLTQRCISPCIFIHDNAYRNASLSDFRELIAAVILAACAGRVCVCAGRQP